MGISTTRALPGILVLTMAACAGTPSTRHSPTHPVADSRPPGCDASNTLQCRLARYEVAALVAAYNKLGTACPTLGQLRVATSVEATDPWGSAYAVKCDSHGFEALSAGPDRELGTSDDLASAPPPRQTCQADRRVPRVDQMPWPIDEDHLLGEVVIDLGHLWSLESAALTPRPAD